MHPSPTPPNEPSLNLFYRNAGVNRAAREIGVFRHKAQRANLRVRSNADADLNDTSEPNGHVMAQVDARRLDDALFHRVARKMDGTADHDIVPEFKQVIVADR